MVQSGCAWDRFNFYTEQHKASNAVFVVHEFRTEATEDVNMDADANALSRFLRVLLSANDCGDGDFEFESGHSVGPISIRARPVPGTNKFPHHIQLFIGKIRTDLLAKSDHGRQSQ